MIIKTLSTSQFADLLLNDQYANWSYEGANLLAEYLEDISEDIGEPIEADIVAVRCEWSELSEDDLLASYGYKVDSCCYTDRDEHLGELVEMMRDETTIVEFDSNGETKFLVQEF